jgi:predicted site-specific integrase-resolvase
MWMVANGSRSLRDCPTAAWDCARVGECGETGVDRLIVEHPDRLARCGAGLIEHLLHGCGVMVVDTGKSEDESAVAELVCDVLAIVTTHGDAL